MEALAGKSKKASQLRLQRRQLVEQFGLPQELIGGILRQGYRRCGKANCHCADGRGHAQWSLSISSNGKRRVQSVPVDWQEDLEEAILKTQDFLDAVKQVMAINLELVAETRRLRPSKKVREERKKARPMWNSYKKRSTHAPWSRSSTM